MMQESAALITAIAALVSALAWPAAFLLLFLIFRRQFGSAMRDMPGMMRRMCKFKLGPFEAELSAMADDLIDEAVARPGAISERQIRSAARIKVAAKSLDDDALEDQLQQLCIEYETIRKVLPAGTERTRAMTGVLVRMRTIAPAVAKFLDDLKRSSAPGSRLAAIAIMQVNPSLADLDWLEARFAVEQPFVFFQAATVLRTLSETQPDERGTYRALAERAMKAMRDFPGTTDAETLLILQSIAAAPVPA